MNDEIKKNEDPHRQLYKLLCGKIADGTYAPHTRLPAERALAGQYGLSQITVNKAMKQLEAQGMIYTRRGVGAFAAAASREYSLNRLHSFHDWCVAGGHVPGTETVCIREAEQGDLDRFRHISGFEAGEYIYMVRKRTMDTLPAIYEERIVSRKIFSVDDIKNMQHSYFAFLASRLPVPVKSSRRVMRLVAAGPEARAFLGVKKQERVICISGATYDADEALIDLDILSYHPDRFEFNYILSH